MTMTKLRLLVFVLAVAGVPVLYAQGSEQAERVRALNNDLLRLHAQLQRAGAGTAASLRSQAAPIIAQRQAIDSGRRELKGFAPTKWRNVPYD